MNMRREAILWSLTILMAIILGLGVVWIAVALAFSQPNFAPLYFSAAPYGQSDYSADDVNVARLNPLDLALEQEVIFEDRARQSTPPSGGANTPKATQARRTAVPQKPTNTSWPASTNTRLPTHTLAPAWTNTPRPAPTSTRPPESTNTSVPVPTTYPPTPTNTLAVPDPINTPLPPNTPPPHNTSKPPKPTKKPPKLTKVPGDDNSGPGGGGGGGHGSSVSVLDNPYLHQLGQRPVIYDSFLSP